MYKYKNENLIHCNVEIEINCDILSAGYYVDYVELYFNGFLVRVPVNSKKEAYYIFKDHGIEWTYD
jgi:hypothetical protein